MWSRASAAYEEALPLFAPSIPHGRAQPGLVYNLARTSRCSVGQVRSGPLNCSWRAAERYRRAGSGPRRGVAECVVGLAEVALRSDKPVLAARLSAVGRKAVLEELGTTVRSSNMAADEALSSLSLPSNAAERLTFLSEDDAL